MKITNSVVRNAVAAYNADGSASMRWYEMYLNNADEKWRLLIAGKPVKARQSFERWKRAVDAMGPKVKADRAQEARDFEAVLAEVERRFRINPMSLVEWRESALLAKAKNLSAKFDDPISTAVVDYYKTAVDKAKKPKAVKARMRSGDDDDYLE